MLAAVLAGPTAFQTALTDLYAYAGNDAADAFVAAETSDPRFVLSYWGEALARGTDLNTGLGPARFNAAQAAIAKAAPYLARAPAQERALVEAAQARYAGSFADRDRDETNYRNAMEAYLKAYPDEDDATMVLVEDLLERHGMHWNDDGTPKDDDSKEILTLTQRVLQRDPQHVFANHLCIHAYDNAPDRTYAIDCAERLDAMTFVEPQEHLAHMPAHLWNELGDGRRAVASSERAWALEPKRYAEHDAYVGLTGALMCGDADAVARWTPRLAAAQGGPVSLAPPEYVTKAARLEKGGATQQALIVLFGAALTQKDATELVPFYPANVRIGALLMRAGRYAQARDMFAAILREHPRLPRALFGLSESFARLGDADHAAQYRAEFARYWAGSPLSIDDF